MARADLLIHVADDEPAGPAPAATFGGNPRLSASQSFTGPDAVCARARWIISAALPSHPRPAPRRPLFQCGHNSGVCDEWDADAGGNRAVPVPKADATDVAVGPAAPATIYPPWAARTDGAPAADYDTARAAWSETHVRAVVGQLGGEPAWIQGDERPACDCCRQPMVFLA